MEKKITLLIIILLLVPIVAIAAHYTVNRDGTVTDNVTGLMWQQEVDYIARTWESAIAYCENLVVPPSTYTDWRLPNSKELRSIIDNSQWNPAIDWTAFPNTNSTYYWTSTEYEGDPVGAWYVTFSYGGVTSHGKTGGSHDVRCVRGEQLVGY
jgi:hypothetical protein